MVQEGGVFQALRRVGVAEDPLRQQAEQEASGEDAARQMLRGKWRALRSGGNSARLGNLIDLWFVAGSLDATNQTAGRSPFIATSNLAELYRRSPLREDSWDCLKLGNARCTDAASPRGICHEEARLTLALTLSLALILPLTLSLTVSLSLTLT